MTTTTNISDMTRALYAQLDRLMAADGEEAIKVESSRAKAVQGIADSVLEANRMAFELLRYRDQATGNDVSVRAAGNMLGTGN